MLNNKYNTKGILIEVATCVGLYGWNPSMGYLFGKGLEANEIDLNLSQEEISINIIALLNKGYAVSEEALNKIDTPNGTLIKGIETTVAEIGTEKARIGKLKKAGLKDSLEMTVPSVELAACVKDLGSCLALGSAIGDIKQLKDWVNIVGMFKTFNDPKTLVALEKKYTATTKKTVKPEEAGIILAGSSIIMTAVTNILKDIHALEGEMKQFDKDDADYLTKEIDKVTVADSVGVVIKHINIYLRYIDTCVKASSKACKAVVDIEETKTT